MVAPVVFILVSLLGLAYAFAIPTELRLQTYLGNHADHFLVFVPWTITWVWACKRQWLRYSVLSIAPVIAEYLQFWMPQHTPDIEGGLVSYLAVMIGLVICEFFYVYSQCMQSTAKS